MKNQTFDILNRQENIHRHLLLEASAGTGKTFSIENLTLRLLLESSSTNSLPLMIDQILIVTFTKASTRDLKRRVRSALVNAKNKLKMVLEGAITNELYDYLAAIVLKGDDELRLAIHRLERALFAFDRAEIYTIHSFSEKMLKEAHPERSLVGGELLESDEVFKIIDDFFRTGIKPPEYTLGQLKSVLRKWDADELKLALKNAVLKKSTISPQKNAEEHKSWLEKELSRLGFEEERLLTDLLSLAPFYNKLSKNGVLKEENRKCLERVAHLLSLSSLSFDQFDTVLDDLLQIHEWYAEENINKTKKVPTKEHLNYPNFYQDFSKFLIPISISAMGYEAVFGRMAHDCQKLLLGYIKREERSRHDDRLVSMREAIQDPIFASKIQARYQAAIIDEFQDTDALQWTIFSKIFLSKTDGKHRLYLVGDPKQSIYAFREADIYTYLNAKNEIGASNSMTLKTNFRSEPSLVEAMNRFFGLPQDKGWFNLPLIGNSLKYEEVLSSSQTKEKPFQDSLGAMHFCLVQGNKKKQDEEILFSYISSEILKLKKMGVSYDSWAILVRDRFQAKRFSSYCKKLNIPTQVQKKRFLTESLAYQGMKELFLAILKPNDLGLMKRVLGGPLAGWSHQSLEKLNDELVLGKVSQVWKSLIEEAEIKGFASFFNRFLRMKWVQIEESVSDYLLQLNDRAELYDDLMQLSELLIEEAEKSGLTLRQLSLFLIKMPELASNEDERLKIRSDAEMDAIKVLTMHFSKGLEFDIVCPLGLITPTNHQETLIPAYSFKERPLTPVTLATKEDLHSYYAEVDAEKMRQLYVAMTRARRRLYVPVIFNEEESASVGTGSPMELFLTLANKRCQKSLIDWIENEKNITYSSLVEENSQAKASLNEIPLLFKPLEISLTFPFEKVFSFSSLNFTKASDLLERSVPKDFFSTLKTAYSLPAGRDTGVILHRILEEIPFDGQTQMVSKMVEGTSFEEWSAVLEEMISKALSTSINLGIAQPFTLRDIDPQKIYREMEFLFPSSDLAAKYDKNILNQLFVSDLSQSYFRGVIDLLFEHEGYYYLLDWKSNWLGDKLEDYTSEKLREASLLNHYDVQAEIYIEACRLYISHFDKRPFEECFGGYICFFLRASNAHYWRLS